MSHLEHWFYVSTSVVEPSELAEVTDKIVAVSVPRNRDLSVTGALIATGTHFAQYIEGPADAIAFLRASICRDPRHVDVLTIEEGPVDARQFPSWSLAYSGEVPFFEALILLCRSMQPSSAKKLLTALISHFGMTDSSTSQTRH